MKTIIKTASKKLTFAIGLFIALLSCGNNSARHTTNNSAGEEKAGISQTKDSFLNNKQGEWICYKYETENAENKFAESYAKEFTKYAYFNILSDTLSAVGIYSTPVYSYKYPVKFNKYNEESVFITALKPAADSVFFVAPYNHYEYYWESSDDLPYYKDAPMNNIQMFWKDDFIVNDRGYFFFFKRGERRDNTIKGVPGDNRNYFKVEKVYEDVQLKEILPLIEQNFPHGSEQVMDDGNKKTFWANDWSENNTLKLEKTQSNGKFVMQITIDGNTVRLIYYSADDLEDDEYPG